MGRPVQQPSPNSLSDDVLTTLTTLAAPIEAALREPFLRAVALELGRHQSDEVGAGLVHRVGRELQREFLKAPARHDPGHFSKYR